jgi:hypothetical protein
MSTAWMGLYGPKIADQGYRIVPIQPGTKRPTGKGWQKFGHHQDDVDIERFVRDTPQWGIGILTAFIPAVDIDVRDPTLALQLHELALQKLGIAPFRIGAFPKRLLPYRTDEPFAKVASRGFRLPGDRPEDKPHRIEILGNGQQFVAYAVHPDTGRPYEWFDGGPLEVAQEDLTPITEEQARAYLREAERLILEAGGRPEAQFADDPGPRKTNANPIAPYDLVADAMRHVPNHDVHYDDWVTVGLAIKAAVGEAGRELFHGYSRQSLKYDGEVTERAWKSFQPERIGAGSIFHWAKEYGGWTRPPSAASRSKAEYVPPLLEPSDHGRTPRQPAAPPHRRSVLQRGGSS